MPSITPELEAGTLDRRVSLLKPVYNDPEDEIVEWEKVTDVWAAIVPTSGVESNSSARTIAMTYLQITIRYRTDIDQRWRIVEGATTYEIEGEMVPLARRAGLRMFCKEGPLMLLQAAAPERMWIRLLENGPAVAIAMACAYGIFRLYTRGVESNRARVDGFLKILTDLLGWKLDQIIERLDRIEQQQREHK